MQFSNSLKFGIILGGAGLAASLVCYDKSSKDSKVKSLNNDDFILTACRLSFFIYGDEQVDIGEWTPCRDEIEKKLGRKLKWEDYKGFKSEIYCKKNLFGIKEYVYAFKGTNPLNLYDVFTDVRIFFERDIQKIDYLKQATENTDEIIKAIGPMAKLTFAGHSLGGAIAMVCAAHRNEHIKNMNPIKKVISKKIEAYVFNTLDAQCSKRDYVHSFVLENDFVHKLHKLFNKRTGNEPNTHIVPKQENVSGGHSIKNLLAHLSEHSNNKKEKGSYFFSKK